MHTKEGSYVTSCLFCTIAISFYCERRKEEQSMTNSIMESNNNERIKPITKKYFISCNYQLFKGFVGQNLTLTDTYLKVANGSITIPLRQITGVEIVKSNSCNYDWDDFNRLALIGFLVGLVSCCSMPNPITLFSSLTNPILFMILGTIKQDLLRINGKAIFIHYGKSTFYLIGTGRDKEESLRFYNDLNEYISMYAGGRN